MPKVTKKERQRCWRRRMLENNKMSEADKLFEELGYTKQMHELFDRYDRVEKDILPHDVLVIDRHEKSFAKFSHGSYGAYITMQELKAINMKCRELGWSDE